MRISATGIIAGAIALVVVAQLQLHWHVAAFLRPPSTASPRHLALDREAGAAGRGRRLRAVVGVQTGFNGPDAQPQYNYQLRREQLRRTWFPNATERIRLERDEGIIVRFVVGHSSDRTLERGMAAEEAAHRDFMRLPFQESYAALNKKTLAFFGTAAGIYEADYIIKVDDDAFLRLDRLPHAVGQWRQLGAGYVGCMKTGQIFTNPELRWYEPQHVLLGSKSYFAHAWGTAYVLSGRMAAFLATLPPDALRFFMNEDVTVGSWMLAFNVTHFDDRRLCDSSCKPTSIVVYDIPKCAGLCDPLTSLPAMAADPACTGGSSKAPMLSEIWRFADT